MACFGTSFQGCVLSDFSVNHVSRGRHQQELSKTGHYLNFLWTGCVAWDAEVFFGMLLRFD